MEEVRIIYFINQFFAGMGGEDKADIPLQFREELLGPGKRLQTLLGDSARIVVTAYCGDNYFAEHRDEILASIVKIAKDSNVQMMVAGPAFNAGRYGFACVETCHAVSASLRLDCVTGMHTENPAVEGYRQYKDRRVFAIPTAGSAQGMEAALSGMAQFILKLAAGSAVGSASEEGYIPRGFRVSKFVTKSGAERAIDMLLDKVACCPFVTEIPIESLEAIPVPPRIANLSDIHLALASSCGITPPDNPARFVVGKNSRWGKFSIEKLDSMKDTRWDIIHSGYNIAFMRDNANFGVPLDVCRDMEREGIFAKLYPFFYGTSGGGGTISAMQNIGKEMAHDIKAEGLDAVLLVST